MTLRETWEILRRSWLLVVTTTITGVALALALSLWMTPIYQAQSQLFVSVQTTDEISGAYTGGLYIQQRIESYVTVVDTPAVLDPVIDELSLDTTYSQLSEQVTAQNPTGTVLIQVLASDADAQRAAEIADAAAESLAAEIERLETTPSGAEPVQVELVRPAKTPEEPYSPRTTLNLALGGLFGLLAGFGISALRAATDTSIKSLDDLTDAVGATPLGAVVYSSDTAKRPLAALTDTAQAEAYRAIRTNLQYVDVDNPPRTVVLTSSMPLEGKSTCAANLAITLAQGGLKVLLVEADLRRPRVGDYLGVDGAVGLTDVLIGQAVLGDAIISWGRGLFEFLPSGAIPPNPSELLGSQQMIDLMAKLSARYNVVILDAPPIIPVTDAAVLSAAADGFILVARYGVTSQEHARQAASALARVNGHVIGTVLTFTPGQRQDRGYAHSYGSNRKRQGGGAADRQGLTRGDLDAAGQGV